MGIERGRTYGGAFTTLHGVLTQGSDPSRGEPGNPVPHIQTVRSQVVALGAGRGGNALISGDPAPSTASLTVDDNDFSDRAILFIGGVALISNMDFIPGGTTTLTAVALAAAISRLPEWEATNVANVVTLTRHPAIDRVSFRVRHTGVVVNFTALTPSTGYLAPGGPLVVAPELA